MYPDYRKVLLTGAAVFGFMATQALADTIDPTSFTANLAMGESVTISKTVTVSAGGPTDAVLDVMFVFDTTGSMGGAIDGAKAAAVDILNGLSGFGDLHSGAGQYDDPGANGVVSDLTATKATTIATINSFFACYGSCGGDFPELGFEGIGEAAANASWRPGSNRFIVAFGDASFKDSVGWNNATTTAALSTNNVSLIGLSSGASFDPFITGLGGTVYAGSTDPALVTAAILAAVTTGFANYSKVTVGDLGNGDPMIDVSAVCTGADIGACVGDTATGTYDRTVSRDFTFDVTFKRTGAGTADFLTHALVDGGIVASEKDHFPGDGGPSPVPLPAAGWLLIASLGGLVAAKRRKS